MFGGGSGGSNVCHLLGSPEAKGLFHKAICQSGSPFTHTEHSAEKVTDAIAKKLLWRRHHFEKNALDQVRGAPQS